MEAYLQHITGVRQAVVHERTCCAVIYYQDIRADLLQQIRDVYKRQVCSMYGQNYEKASHCIKYALCQHVMSVRRVLLVLFFH